MSFMTAILPVILVIMAAARIKDRPKRAARTMVKSAAQAVCLGCVGNALPNVLNCLLACFNQKAVECRQPAVGSFKDMLETETELTMKT
jgi:hypothetical protein